jgi:O-Antigen ligase
MLANEGLTLYSKYMFAPLAFVQDLLFEPLPIKVRPFDLIMGLVLVYALTRRDSRGPRVRPMRTTVLIAATTIVAWFVLGMLRGGDPRAGSWQVYLMLASLLTAFVVAATCRTAEHVATFGKAILAAGLYRAVMCVIFYMLYIHTVEIMPPPEYLTTHDDSVLWTVSIVIMVAYAIETRSRKAITWACVLVPFFVLAIQLNNRRLAWVSLAGGLAAVYVLLRASPMKRRINRALILLAPAMILYVMVGWDRSERIFRPLKSFATVSTEEDASTKARDAEALGLIATADRGWILGTGWGHGYTAVTDKYYIGNYFELWQYVPHNSILGLLAFTGVLGVGGYWLMFPTAVFFHARTARLARRPLERTVGIVGVSQILICANQMFGDMGIFSTTAMYILATGFGVAMRLPVEAGVWKGARPVRSLVLAPAE